MTRSKLRALTLGGCGLLLLPALGCAFAADLVNPDFLRQVGFDPATIVPPPGRVVVAFTNDTDQSVTFYAYVAEEALGDQVTSGDNLTASAVPAGITSSEAVDCPFEFMGPGRLDASLNVGTDAAVVGDVAGQEAVAYEGAALVMGVDFVCGDLIEIRLVQTGDEDQAQYALRVQVYPGR